MKKVSIVGAGQMGSGIAQVFATSGFCVKIYDVSEEILQKSTKRIKNSLDKLFSKNIIEEYPRDIQSRISYHLEISELAGSQIFIESAFEDFDLKMNILYKLAEYITRETYVASNTSSFSITSLSKMLPYPEKFLGFHFMNPPPLMTLIEVVRGYYTSQETCDFFEKTARQLKKIPIFSRNSPGFVLNRILIPMINEAIHALYENVSTAEQIDEALKLGANHPIGPLALADLIGLDTVLAILKNLQKELGEDKYAPCPLLEEYVRKGLLGRKTKKGFYEYT